MCNCSAWIGWLAGRDYTVRFEGEMSVGLHQNVVFGTSAAGLPTARLHKAWRDHLKNLLFMWHNARMEGGEPIRNRINVGVSMVPYN